MRWKNVNFMPALHQENRARLYDQASQRGPDPDAHYLQRQALFQRRLADNAAPIQDGPIDTFYPNWLRLSCESTERIGFLRFKGELSADGVNWQQLGALAEIAISGRVMVGLVLTTQARRSNTASQENALATFSDVVVTPMAD